MGKVASCAEWIGLSVPEKNTYIQDYNAAQAGGSVPDIPDGVAVPTAADLAGASAQELELLAQALGGTCEEDLGLSCEAAAKINDESYWQGKLDEITKKLNETSQSGSGSGNASGSGSSNASGSGSGSDDTVTTD